MSESRKQKLNKIINDLREIEERLEKIEQDIENPNNLLLIGAPIRLLINILDDLDKFRKIMWYIIAYTSKAASAKNGEYHLSSI